MSEIKSIGLSREAWGPRFWKILHVLAEHSGNQTNQIMSNDEVDAWILLLKSQALVMPCTLCKQHYLEWYKLQKIDGLKEFVGEQRRDWIRKWLWGCHKRVNEMNQKNTPPLETLTDIYKKQTIEKEFKELITMFQAAFNQQQLKSEDVSRWKTVIVRLRSMYGL
jgi:hypothetical protein